MPITLPAYQPFHLVSLSPWPLLTSFILFDLALGLVSWFNGVESFQLLGLNLSPGYGLLLALLTTIAVMAVWFRDVTVEGVLVGDHTLEVQRLLSFGFLLFVTTEVMVFLAIFWSWFHSGLSPVVELGSSWPPVGIEGLDIYALPLMNTILLLASGAAVTVGHHALIGGMRAPVLWGLTLTVALAAVFTAFQGIEYSTANFTITDGVFGTTFYVSTGTHGFHVGVGTAFIAVCLVRAYRYHFTATHHAGLENAIVYWHMVDVVWLFLFVVVYYWPSTSV